LPIELITEPNRTKKESAILQMFNKSSHLSVEQIKEKLPDKYKNLSKRTISNITEKLVNENILQFAMEGKKIYGLTNSSGIL
ncbi:TPA: BlaI/MecI/CopY family transcriptional regulator, partial [Streptococcus pyogenes]|nr:BlaI/MecI/CopY family transcriptional regulator [Streptococcus pyogenes]